jgi:hypothetical protein
MDKINKVFPDEEFEVTNSGDSCLACCFTCGAAGWGTDTMKLKRDDM